MNADRKFASFILFVIAVTLGTIAGLVITKLVKATCSIF